MCLSFFTGFLIAAIFNDFMFAAYIGAGSNLIMSFTCGKCDKITDSRKTVCTIKSRLNHNYFVSDNAGSIKKKNMLSRNWETTKFVCPTHFNNVKSTCQHVAAGLDATTLNMRLTDKLINRYSHVYTIYIINYSYCPQIGLIWPLEGAHYLLQITGPLFPLTAPVRALLAITARGWSYDAEPVYTGFLSIFCWSGVLIIALYVTSRRNKNLWVITK